jgi:hypothetical protein
MRTPSLPIMVILGLSCIAEARVPDAVGPAARKQPSEAQLRVSDTDRGQFAPQLREHAALDDLARAVHDQRYELDAVTAYLRDPQVGTSTSTAVTRNSQIGLRRLWTVTIGPARSAWLTV